jgi:hypothetical protein
MPDITSLIVTFRRIHRLKDVISTAWVFFFGHREHPDIQPTPQYLPSLIDLLAFLTFEVILFYSLIIVFGKRNFRSGCDNKRDESNRQVF